MKIGVPLESNDDEARVSLTPDSVEDLAGDGHSVLIQSGAGARAGFSDELYQDAGAEVSDEEDELYQSADLIAHVSGPDPRALDSLYREDQVVVGLLGPYDNQDELESLAEDGASGLALELMPRISRAQSMDALSSQSNIGGYKSVIMAAERLPRIFPQMMTAAGTIQPARVFVIGAGVAGLQAIATAKRLGARVEGYDIRLEVKQQVESLGADFVELDLETEGAEGDEGYAREMDEEFYAQQRERLGEVLEYSDVVVTTANIPGKPAPELIEESMVENMKPGSVIVDMAAGNGGNCELTEADETQTVHDVTIMGPTNLPATVPDHASELYGNNLVSLIGELTDEDGNLVLDQEDEVVDSILVTHEGRLRNPHLDDEESEE